MAKLFYPIMVIGYKDQETETNFEVELRRFKNDLEADEYMENLNLDSILKKIKRKKIEIPSKVKYLLVQVQEVMDYGDFEDCIHVESEEMYRLDKFFISTNGSSGISSKTLEETLNYIKEELERVIEENPNEVIDIEINSYEEGEE
jgi:hypothetical protein